MSKRDGVKDAMWFAEEIIGSLLHRQIIFTTAPFDRQHAIEFAAEQIGAALAEAKSNDDGQAHDCSEYDDGYGQCQHGACADESSDDRQKDQPT